MLRSLITLLAASAISFAAPVPRKSNNVTVLTEISTSYTDPDYTSLEHSKVVRVGIVKDLNTGNLAYGISVVDKLNVSNTVFIMEKVYVHEEGEGIKLNYVKSTELVQYHHYAIIKKLREEVDVLEGVRTWQAKLDYSGIAVKVKRPHERHTTKTIAGRAMYIPYTWDIWTIYPSSQYLGVGNWKPYDRNCGCFH